MMILDIKIKKIFEILRSSKEMKDIILLEDGSIGFHTSIPQWDDNEESWEEYLGRNNILPEEYYRGGISPSTWEKIESLGFEISLNDSPSCEGEGIIYKRIG